MNAKWILPLVAMTAFVGCAPKIEPVPKYKAPEFKTPKPELNPELLRRLGESLKCKEATKPTVNLSGALEPTKITDLTGGEVGFGKSKPISYKSAKSGKGTLIHNGCPADVVKEEAGDLEVVVLSADSAGVAAADKVMLCGNQSTFKPSMILAHTLVLKDYSVSSEPALMSLNIKAGILKLSGKNKIEVVRKSDSLALAFGNLELNVEDHVEGDGYLELDSKVVTCAQVEAERKSKEPVKF